MLGALRRYAANIDDVTRLKQAPPRQNSCRPDRSPTSAAMKEERSGKIRQGIQRQSGGAVVAAGERIAGRGGARVGGERRHAGALAQRGAVATAA